MKLGIFSKLNYPGGSEFRCVELANQFARMNHEVCLFGEGEINSKVAARLEPNVRQVANLLLGRNEDRPLDLLYALDSLFVVNSDSKNFTTASYWLGQSGKHKTIVDLKRIRQVNFIFNFLISPSISLPTLKPHISDIRILTTNSKFFNEISKQDRYESVRPYPRMIIESPIDYESIKAEKTSSNEIRLGMHSLPVDSKWNADFPSLIHEVNAEYQVKWDFMGMPRELAARIKASNITLRKEFSVSVKEYLSGLDLFCFYGSFSREEPWSRAVAEALTSGCPVISTNRGGNADQIIHGNNGFLCSNHDDFRKSIKMLLDNPDILHAQKTNAIRTSKAFSSVKVAGKLLEFII
jgi:glycosyltransferase involved in cell wall biosynthesis